MSEAKPGYLFQFQTDLGGGQAVSVSGNLPVGVTLAEGNKEFDLVRALLERQRAKSAIDGAQQQIERGEATLARLAADISVIDTKQQGKPLSHQEKTHRDNAVASATDLKKQLDKQRADLEKIKKEAE